MIRTIQNLKFQNPEPAIIKFIISKRQRKKRSKMQLNLAIISTIRYFCNEKALKFQNSEPIQ
jgi:hypothetical protein